MMEHGFSSGNCRLLGRAFEYNGMVGMSYSASGIEFTCEDGFDVYLKADRITDADDADIRYARYAVYADDVKITDRRLEKTEDSISVCCPGMHVFKLLKLSESDDSTMFIFDVKALNGNVIQATQEKARKIEFIGDSITCGYGMDGRFGEGETYTTATEDASSAYAYLAAMKLGWDCSLVSKSGAGIISGYDGMGRRNIENLLPPYYESVGCSQAAFEDGNRPENIRWGFDNAPDIIVINLGTNDKSYCRPDCGITDSNIEEEDMDDICGPAWREMSGSYDVKAVLSKLNKDDNDGEDYASRVCERRCRLFRESYIDFLKLVRSHNRESYIICSLGIMEDAINSDVEAAVREYSEQTGDRNIEWFEFEKQDIEIDGIVTDYHPSPKTHRDRAEKLYEHIAGLEAGR